VYKQQARDLLKGAAVPGVVLWVFLGVAQLAMADTGRWYTQDQVARGAGIFSQNCAECHGANAEATQNWREPNADGKFPSPPLNGTAHTWHHPLEMLRRTIRTGGVPLGGLMPAFEDKLSAQDTDAAIAFFQSKWSDKTYSAWQERKRPPSGLQPVASRPPVDSVTSRLRQRLPTANIGKPETTPVSEIFQVRLGSGYAYVTKDGRYAFVGDLVDLETGVNLTDTKRNRDTLTLVADFADQDMVVYPAEGKETARIRVFTDVSCPYCRKLHKEVPALQKAGVTVAYIAFPRSGPQGSAYHDMRAVWCADDRRLAMDIAKGVASGQLVKGDCASATAVDAGYRLGQKIGIRGTPAIVFPDGSIQAGFVPANQVITRLKALEPGAKRLSKVDPGL
jgi:thiol:disulfide interchange protein DsbC